LFQCVGHGIRNNGSFNGEEAGTVVGHKAGKYAGRTEEQVGVAVVINVTGINAQARHHLSGLLDVARVFEFAGAFAEIEFVVVTHVGEIEVQDLVAVEVGYGHAAAYRQLLVGTKTDRGHVILLKDDAQLCCRLREDAGNTLGRTRHGVTDCDKLRGLLGLLGAIRFVVGILLLDGLRPSLALIIVHALEVVRRIGLLSISIPTCAEGTKQNGYENKSPH
jgi:hypothetical protein